MDFKKKFRIFQRTLARSSLYFFYGIFSVLPYWAVRFFAGGMLALAQKLLIRQRRIAMESLQIAFGDEKSPAELRKIAKQCFWNLGWGMVEMLYYLSRPRSVSEKVVIEGKEYLDQALAEGRGVIAVTAHFGNFPLMMLSCAQQGYPAHSIIRPARDEELEQFLVKKREEVGLKTVYAVPKRQCVVKSLRVLRNNGLLFMPVDQNFGSLGGVYVDFFGSKAATAPGPIIFSLRTKAPILPIFIVRQEDDTHKIIVEKPVTLKVYEDEEKTVLENMQNVTDIIESYIRKYPHEWAWMHRRWKSKPLNRESRPRKRQENSV